MRLIVAGDRHFTDYEALASKLDHIVGDSAVEFVISGGATGTDSLGERWAKANGHDLIRMPALWDHYGRSAGPIRNAHMALLGTHLVAFLAPNSRGTKSMIEIARRKDLNVRVVHVGDWKDGE